MHAAVPGFPKRILVVTSALHICSDAFFAILYPLLPFIALDLGLSYAEVGLLKTAFSASSAVFQLPAGLLAERLGEYALLVWGNGWVAAGLVGMAAASSGQWLILLALLAGLGGSTQHPLASALVARAYEGGKRASALGTLNFTGDLGKMLAPTLVLLATPWLGWRGTLMVLGVFGLVFSLSVGLARAWASPPSPAPAPRAGTGAGGAVGGLPSAYWLLGLVGALDGATRGAALTFLPFVFESRGFSPELVSILFAIIFAGGAAGKLLCGLLGDKFGPFGVVLITEIATALAIVGLLGGSLGLALVLALVFGFSLNGTSSVLYAAVATLVPEGKRGRGYGLFYTLALCGSSFAPVVYGLGADRFGLDWTMWLMAALTLLIAPLAVPLRSKLVAA